MLSGLFHVAAYSCTRFTNYALYHLFYTETVSLITVRVNIRVILNPYSFEIVLDLISNDNNKGQWTELLWLVTLHFQIICNLAIYNYISFWAFFNLGIFLHVNVTVAVFSQHVLKDMSTCGIECFIHLCRVYNFILSLENKALSITIIVCVMWFLFDFYKYSVRLSLKGPSCSVLKVFPICSFTNCSLILVHVCMH